MARAERIRYATLDEVGELEELQRRASLEHEDYREQLLAHPDAIELPLAYVSDRRVRVAVRPGRLVGFSVVLAAAADRARELDGLFVEPDCWRQGVGRRLMGDAVERARREGAPSIQVTANPYARAFYEAVGFRESGSADTRFGAACRMRLVLL